MSPEYVYLSAITTKRYIYILELPYLNKQIDSVYSSALQSRYVTETTACDVTGLLARSALVIKVILPVSEASIGEKSN